MEEYLNMGIKEVLDSFPEVGAILDEYGIGCAPCSVGSCLFKDIVEIHNLPVDRERELMVRIATVIYPDREIEFPWVERAARDQGPREVKYSPPMRKLVDEHVLIKRLIARIPEVIEDLDVESEPGRQRVLDVVDFIRSYADRFHHAKEEELLFKYFDGTIEVIEAMHEEHEKARAHVRAIVEAVEARDTGAIVEHLRAYRELLTEHIKKEDEILYPWMDRNLSVTQVGELFSKFNEADSRAGEETPARYERFVNRLEQAAQAKEARK